MSKKHGKWILPAALIMCLLLPGLSSARAAAPTTATPIQHFVMLMQQNHTFDNYFGTFPGAEGIPANACMPSNGPEDRTRTCVKPFHLEDYPVVDMPHNGDVFNMQYNNGRMDGFVRSITGFNLDGNLPMAYYDDRDVGYYWGLAKEYVLFDHYFSSAHAGSVPNRMFWVSGVPGTLSNNIPNEGFGDLQTIFDELQARGISWKFYVANYDPSLNYQKLSSLNYLPPQVQWVPLLSFARFVDDPALSSHIVDLSEYYRDLHQGTLPAVSFITLQGGISEHPSTDIRQGERAVKSIIQALMESDAWWTSAFMLTYDEGGSWYDHVAPPQVDAYGYGFRVPALLVSPYARQGAIDSTVLDHTSSLRFIEENWGIPSLARRDATANSFVSAFDFAQEARQPAFIAFSPTEPVAVKQPDRGVIYVTYGSALALGLLTIVGVAIREARRGPRKERAEELPL